MFLKLFFFTVEVMYFLLHFNWSRDSVVGLAIWLLAGRFGVRKPVGAWKISLL